MDKASQIAVRQWDKIAPVRFEQIRLGLDLNYCQVLKPKTLELFDEAPLKTRVLDLGCGVGDLAKELRQRGADTVVAVDSSSKSIEIAKKHYSSVGVEFHHGESTEFYNTKFGTIVASMFLMDTPKLSKEMRGIGRALRTGGTLIVSLPHPCFWPIRRNYFSDSDYSYFDESVQSGPFSLSNRVMMEYNTTHFARPLSAYLNEVSRNGMRLTSVIELPDHNHEDRSPRFVFLVARKES